MAVRATDFGGKDWSRRTIGGQLAIWFMWLCGVAIFMFCWQKISNATTWPFFWDAPRIADEAHFSDIVAAGDVRQYDLSSAKTP